MIQGALPSSLAVPFDPRVPNAARIYDYYLDGKDNFPADREMAEQILQLVPDVREAARSNRRFLGRAVRHLAAQGMRQFIDLGSGLPTSQNVHQVAQDIDPRSRVVYVDRDPVVLTHARALLTTETNSTAVVEGDLRHPTEVLAAIQHDERGRRLVNFDLPVAVLMVAVLHFVSDADDPGRIVKELAGLLAPGSWLVMSHASADAIPKAKAKAAVKLYARTPTPLTPRPRTAIEHLFTDAGWELAEPGLVEVDDWQPDPDPWRLDSAPTPKEAQLFGGIALLPPTFRLVGGALTPKRTT